MNNPIKKSVYRHLKFPDGTVTSLPLAEGWQETLDFLDSYFEYAYVQVYPTSKLGLIVDGQQRLLANTPEEFEDKLLAFTDGVKAVIEKTTA